MGGALDLTRRVREDAVTAATAIDDLQRLLAGGDCPPGERQAAKHRLRCKAMATGLRRIADQWAASAPDSTTRRLCQDAAAAIADLQRLLAGGDCPLGDREAATYLLRCQAMAHRAARHGRPVGRRRRGEVSRRPRRRGRTHAAR